MATAIPLAEGPITTEELLDWKRLKAPISAEVPAGQPVLNTPDYDALRDLLNPREPIRPDAARRDARPTASAEAIRKATALLSEQSKDLDVAVWLTEALTRQHGIAGLAEGLLLLDFLLNEFWDTVYPQLDEDGDEGYRAKPLRKLNAAFVRTFAQFEITSDGKTLWHYNNSSEVPSEEEAERREEKRKKRDELLADGYAAPEAMARSIAETNIFFYQGLLSGADGALEALGKLVSTCDRRFKTDDRPVFEALTDQLMRFRAAVDSMHASKGPAEPVSEAAVIPAAPAAVERVEHLAEPPAYQPFAERLTPQAHPPQAAEAAHPPATAEAEHPSDIVAMAERLRSDNPGSPAPYMVLLGFAFGGALADPSFDTEHLIPPSSGLRIALRKAFIAQDWSVILDRASDVVREGCGHSWLDAVFYWRRACEELGYAAAAQAIADMTAAFTRRLPWLATSLMADGSPVAAADTQRWLASISTDAPPPTHNLPEEVRLIDFDTAGEESEDAFAVAERSAAGGDFREACRVLAEAAASEAAGRDKFRRRMQMADMCMRSGKLTAALPILQDACRIADEHRLERWESVDFVAAPLAMLYRCLAEQQDADLELRQSVYARLCNVDPLRAIELSD